MEIRRKKMREYVSVIIIGTVIAVTLWCIAISIHAYSKGWVNSSTVPTYTLTNGEKTVVFQSMMHIGLKSFYKEVGEEMTQYRKDGYRVMLEGIGTTGIKPLRPGEKGYEEAVSKFNSWYPNYITKITKTESEKYKDIPYTHQLLSFDRYIAYDDEIVDFTREKMNNVITQTKEKSGLTDKSVNTYKDTLGDHSDGLNMLINHDKFFTFMINTKDFFAFKLSDTYINPLLMSLNPAARLDYEVTMVARNKNLADHIIAEPEHLIYITYGGAHFEGVFNLLKESDPRWEIIKTSDKFVLKN